MVSLKIRKESFPKRNGQIVSGQIRQDSKISIESSNYLAYYLENNLNKIVEGRSYLECVEERVKLKRNFRE